jgi:predicted transcriptional regulator
MSDEKLGTLNKKMEAILGLGKAPSQNIVFFHLLGTGKTMTVGEISGEVGLTSKATERAVAKLLEKGLIQRAPFRARSYSCDSKEIIMGLLVAVQNLRERLDRRGL